jgi:uncharacterized protein
LKYIYLHGFASSPNSFKAQDLGRRFAQIQINLIIPDLNAQDFSHLTISRQIEQISALFPDSSSPVTLIGSSLGGLTAAYLGEKYPQIQRLILLAPAFGFLSHWLPRLGRRDSALEPQDFLQLREATINQWQQEKYLLVYHHGAKKELPLHYNFVTDAQKYSPENLQRPISTLILHGVHDEVIPIEASRDFQRSHPQVKLVELDSDHALANVTNDIWQEITQFCWESEKGMMLDQD